MRAAIATMILLLAALGCDEQPPTPQPPCVDDVVVALRWTVETQGQDHGPVKDPELEGLSEAMWFLERASDPFYEDQGLRELVSQKMRTAVEAQIRCLEQL